MYQDEARFGLIADVRRAWAPKPIRPLCCGMLTHEYAPKEVTLGDTYAYAAVDILTGALDALILPYVNTACMQVFLDEVAARHPDDRIVMVLDGAGWHASHDLHVPDNIHLLPLPPYAPELNPVEHVWDEIREKHFCNLSFNSLDALEDYLEISLRNAENQHDRFKSIVHWPWIVNALLN